MFTGLARAHTLPCSRARETCRQGCQVRANGAVHASHNRERDALCMVGHKRERVLGQVGRAVNAAARDFAREAAQLENGGGEKPPPNVSWSSRLKLPSLRCCRRRSCLVWVGDGGLPAVAQLRAQRSGADTPRLRQSANHRERLISSCPRRTSSNYNVYLASPRKRKILASGSCSSLAGHQIAMIVIWRPMPSAHPSPGLPCSRLALPSAPPSPRLPCSRLAHQTCYRLPRLAL